VTANLAIAATFIIALTAWNLAATLPLPLGVAGHEGSTVIVGLNGLRLLRARRMGAMSPANLRDSETPTTGELLQSGLRQPEPSGAVRSTSRGI
jgi:hypothetical protein